MTQTVIRNQLLSTQNETKQKANIIFVLLILFFCHFLSILGSGFFFALCLRMIAFAILNYVSNKIGRCPPKKKSNKISCQITIFVLIET